MSMPAAADVDIGWPQVLWIMPFFLVLWDAKTVPDCWSYGSPTLCLTVGPVS